MAFAAVKAMDIGSARGSNPSIGDLAIELWTFTELTSDTGGTFTTAISRPILVMATPGQASANAVGSSFSGQTITVVTAGTAPTTGSVIVIGYGR